VQYLGNHLQTRSLQGQVKAVNTTAHHHTSAGAATGEFGDGDAGGFELLQATLHMADARLAIAMLPVPEDVGLALQPFTSQRRR